MTRGRVAAGTTVALVLALATGCADRSSASPATASTATPTSTPTAASVPPATPTASPSPPSALDPEALARAVDAGVLRRHLEELQRIADRAGGDRSYRSPGAAMTESYIEFQLGAADYRVERHEFRHDGGRAANLTADIGDGADVIVLGAHLDSVPVGPGINDNGSGVAALLAVADALRDAPPPSATVRFAFWGAEEGGSFGSTAYVASLPPEELNRIVAYLNFDMLGSPNAVRFVYDEHAAASGSELLTELLASVLDEARLAWEPVDLEGDSDHGPFSDAGIATGGLFTGGIEPVTAEQAARHGAAAGQPADPCSHMACDTIENVDVVTLEEMTRVIAGALGRLAGG